MCDTVCHCRGYWQWLSQSETCNDAVHCFQYIIQLEAECRFRMQFNSFSQYETWNKLGGLYRSSALFKVLRLDRELMRLLGKDEMNTNSFPVFIELFSISTWLLVELCMRPRTKTYTPKCNCTHRISNSYPTIPDTMRSIVNACVDCLHEMPLLDRACTSFTCLWTTRLMGDYLSTTPRTIPTTTPWMFLFMI